MDDIAHENETDTEEEGETNLNRLEGTLGNELSGLDSAGNQIWMEEVISEGSHARRARLREALERDEGAIIEKQWEELLRRAEHRSDLGAIEDAEENNFIFKDGDSLWEIGCQVCNAR